MNKKIISIMLVFVFVAFISGLYLGKSSNLSSEIVIGSDNLSGYEDSFGSTVAIYVEQTEGQGDYIQKNNVPDDGSVYVVNSATHCIGGGI